MNKRFPFLVFCLLMFLSPFAFSQSGHMTLLAVSETENGYVGGTADLYLDIKPGSGRIFLETFPFTKVDTQMSTRFANEIACDHLDIDCSQYDFFYTLTAHSSIIGGPSAGAAIATLTSAMLLGLDIDEDVAITGTINSGGLIGPVGGLKEKVGAGSKMGLLKILIPKGEALLSNETTRNEIFNQSTKKTQIKEVYTLDEAIFEFTGKRIEREQNIEIDSQYAATMGMLAKELCDRTGTLSKESETKKEAPREGVLLASNLSMKGKAALDEGRLYSAASFCFGANVEYTRNALLEDDLDEEEMTQISEKLMKDIGEFEEDLDSRAIRTITDLESFMVSKERVGEARDYANIALNSSNTTEQIGGIAWGTERLNSARSWSQFFGKEGRNYEFDEASLSSSCALKIAEAQERVQYLELFLPLPLTSARAEITDAQKESDSRNYELCLYKASKAKASVDIVLGVFGVEQQKFKEILDVKLLRVKEMLAEESANGVFPILGYSYYEYAQSLAESDTLSALLYAEYALELGNLDMYFKRSNGHAAAKQNPIDKKYLLVFSFGVIVGGIAVLAIRRGKVGANKKRVKK